MSIRPTTEVIVVGAGPTGLLLAGDLAAAGVAVTVLERRAEESNLTRAFAVHARTLEQLDARGVADELIATGRRIGRLRLFGSVELDLSRLPSRFPFVLITPQYQTERVLAERASALGVEFVTGATVTGLRQDPDGVDVDVTTADGRREVRRAAYVVGTDGVRSAVRAALGLDFPGQSAIRSVMLADVRLATPPADALVLNGVGTAFAFIVPFGDGWYRVIAWDRHRQLPDDAPVELDEIKAVTRTALGTDFGMHDARWLSRFHSDERQAPRYRVGRVLLAGDAAHVHSPAGGQGMNTGLQDAANLGWKLAAAIQGRAPAGLLDSYQAERHPVGRMVLRGSGALLRLALLRTAPQRAARNLLARVAIRIRPVAGRIVGTVSGVGISYGEARRAPDVALAGETRLYEALRSGRFVLVTHQAPPPGLAERVDVVAPAAETAQSLLVRPDGYLAWTSDDPALPGLSAALDRWLAAPATAST